MSTDLLYGNYGMKKPLLLAPKITGRFAGFSPNWAKIKSITGQTSAVTGQTPQPQETYGLLKPHWDVASKAARESEILRKQRRLAEEQLELQKEQVKKSDEGGTVICTELFRQCYLPLHIYGADARFREIYIDEETYDGYRMWADKVVQWMKKSKVITEIVSWFAIPWAYEAANRVNPVFKGHWFGKILMKVGIPFCRYLGQMAYRGVKHGCL